MQSYQLPNMTCGHCLRSVTSAVQALDPLAEVQADLPAHRVQIDTTAAAEAVVAALSAAGYPPADPDGAAT